MKFSAHDVKTLREETGMGMMSCRLVFEHRLLKDLISEIGDDRVKAALEQINKLMLFGECRDVIENV